MKATILYGPGDVRFEERPDPRIIEPTGCYYQAFRLLRMRL